MTRLQSNLELRNTYMRSVSVHLENRRQHTPFSLSLPLGVLCSYQINISFAHISLIFRYKMKPFINKINNKNRVIVIFTYIYKQTNVINHEIYTFIYICENKIQKNQVSVCILHEIVLALIRINFFFIFCIKLVTNFI